MRQIPLFRMELFCRCIGEWDSVSMNTYGRDMGSRNACASVIIVDTVVYFPGTIYV